MKKYDFGVIAEPFDKLMAAMGNKIDREFPKARSQHGGSRALVLGIYQGARNTFASARFLLADTPPNPSRKAEFALAASPLCRAQVDAICSVVYLFADLPERTAAFYRSGWRELLEETERVRKRHGTDESWHDWLTGRTAAIQELSTLASISPKEKSQPRLVPYWPTPKRMIDKTRDRSRKEFLEHLYDWFYRAFSQDAHYAWGGIARSLPILAPRADNATRKDQLSFVRNRQVSLCIVFMMVLMTELELELKFGLDDRLKYVWTVLRDWSDEGRDLYDQFYKPLLGPASSSL